MGSTFGLKKNAEGRAKNTGQEYRMVFPEPPADARRIPVPELGYLPPEINGLHGFNANFLR